MQNTSSLKSGDYIYKIAPSTPSPSWPAVNESDQSTPVLPPSDLDKHSNFIHMSKAAQISGTLKHFFPCEVGRKDSVWLLRVRVSEDLGERNVLRWENPDASVCGQRDDEGLFPHLYFPANLEDRKEEVEAGSNYRLFLTKGEIDSALEVVSESDVSGYDRSLQSAGVKQWLI